MTLSKTDLAGTNLLFVAYFYPPVESTEVPGSMRTIKFVRHLCNGALHVLTRESGITPGDNALAHLNLPVNGESIHRVRSLDIFRFLLAIRARLRARHTSPAGGDDSAAGSAPVFRVSGDDAPPRRSRMQRCKDFIYNVCYFPDQAGPWILPAVLRGRRLVRQHNLDCIFATGSPWSGLVAGLLISRLTGKPLIADFRDPWINNPFHTSKGPLLDRLGQWLEERVVRHAAAISLNTDALREEFLTRYPDMDPQHFFVMPNGIDLSDIAQQPATPPRRQDRQTLTLCHAGFLYGVRDPASLLEAIRTANQRLAPTGRRIVFRQIGNVSLGYDLREKFSDLIEQGTLILEPARPYQDCLSALANADVVVNIQSGTRTQVPSKLYDYLAINRPILHITPADGALGRLVHRYQLGTRVDFGETPKLVSHLLEYSGQLAGEGVLNGHYPSRDQFLIENITGNLVSRIHQVTGKASV